MKSSSLRPFLPTATATASPLPTLHLFPSSPHHRHHLLSPTLHRQRRRRTYAIQTSQPPTLQVFNSAAKFQQRERAASNPSASRRVDYLRDEIAGRLCERLLDIKRHFPTVLDLGANACHIARALSASQAHTQFSHLTSADSSPAMLHRDAGLAFNTELGEGRHERRVVPVPDSAPLPFEPGSFAAVVSSLSLHWVNDLPSLLAQVNRVLQPDAPFLAAMLGGDSLFELRTSLQLADLDRRGGVATHVSPLADVRDMGGLLTRAGFAMLTVDVDDVVVDYPDTWALMRDLQAMGESNAVVGRALGGASCLSRDVMLANEGIYRALHGNADGTIPATFRVIFMIGWTEGEGQPKPLARGSGQVNLKDILEGKKPV